jgi:SAM-dependent methyltransferase
MKPYRESHITKRIADRYQDVVYADDTFDSILWREEKKILDHEVSLIQNPRYLDFACGTGRILSYLEGDMKESVGVDNSKEMLKIASSKVSKSKLVLGDITAHDVLKGSEFDLITAFRFFLNAEPSLRDDALRVLVPKLAPDGVFIFNIHGNSFSYRIFIVVWYALFGRHLNHVSHLGIRRMIKSHGIKIVRMYGFGIVPKVLYRFLPKRLLYSLDRMFAKIPVLKFFSYNLIFVCKRIN